MRATLSSFGSFILKNYTEAQFRPHVQDTRTVLPLSQTVKAQCVVDQRHGENDHAMRCPNLWNLAHSIIACSVVPES